MLSQDGVHGFFAGVWHQAGPFDRQRVGSSISGTGAIPAYRRVDEREQILEFGRQLLQLLPDDVLKLQKAHRIKDQILRLLSQLKALIELDT
jgi:hypothetical protein